MDTRKVELQVISLFFIHELFTLKIPVDDHNSSH